MQRQCAALGVAAKPTGNMVQFGLTSSGGVGLDQGSSRVGKRAEFNIVGGCQPMSIMPLHGPPGYTSFSVLASPTTQIGSCRQCSEKQAPTPLSLQASSIEAISPQLGGSLLALYLSHASSKSSVIPEYLSQSPLSARFRETFIHGAPASQER